MEIHQMKYNWYNIPSVRLKTVTIITSLLCLIPLLMMGQERQLKKAVSLGKNRSLEYKAEFRKLPLDKKNEIVSWCNKNGYLVKEIKTYNVQRFGGATHTFIRSASFIIIEDQAYLDAVKKNHPTAYDQFLEKYPKSNHREIVLGKLVQTVDQIYLCRKYGERYTSIQTKLEQKAASLAMAGNTSKIYAEYLDQYPKGAEYEIIATRLCEVSTTIDECSKFSKKYTTLQQCLLNKAFNLAKDNPTKEKLSAFLTYFPNTDYTTAVQTKLIGVINTIEDCKKYCEIHPDLRITIQSKATQLAINGDLSIRKSYLQKFPGSPDWPKINDLVVKEEDRISKEKLAADKRKQELAAQEKAKREAELQRQQEQESLKREARERQLALNRKTANWLIGDKVCSLNASGGTTMGVIHQFNKDRSNIEIKIIGGSGDRYDNQVMNIGDIVWTSSTKWYKCIGDEEVNFDYSSSQENKSSSNGVSDNFGKACFFYEIHNYKEDAGSLIGNILSFPTKWTVEFTGIIESDLGNSVKVIIKEGNLIDKMWSINMYSHRSSVDNYIQNQIGKTRVLSKSEIKM